MPLYCPDKGSANHGCPDGSRGHLLLCYLLLGCYDLPFLPALSARPACSVRPCVAQAPAMPICGGGRQDHTERLYVRYLFCCDEPVGQRGRHNLPDNRYIYLFWTAVLVISKLHRLGWQKEHANCCHAPLRAGYRVWTGLQVANSFSLLLVTTRPSPHRSWLALNLLPIAR